MGDWNLDVFLVDMNEGRIIEDKEIKSEIVNQKPYKKWLDKKLTFPQSLHRKPSKVESESFDKRLKIFGYTQEDLSTIINPMSLNAKESIGSMGTDNSLAVFSEKLLNFFTIISSNCFYDKPSFRWY